MNISDGRLALIGELMGPTRIVREVFERNRREDSLVGVLAYEFLDGREVMMQECELPYRCVEVAPLSQNIYDFVVKLFLFQHPKDLCRLEDIRIKDISLFEESYHLVFVSRAEDIFKGLQFVDTPDLFGRNWRHCVRLSYYS